MPGEQDLTQRQNYLQQLPENTWVTKEARMPQAGQARVLSSYPSAAVFAVAMHSVWLGLFFRISSVEIGFLPSLPVLVGYRCEP